MTDDQLHDDDVDSTTPTGDSTPEIDQAPGNQDAAGDDENQNPPLPDGGPTDGEHGVDSPE